MYGVPSPFLIINRFKDVNLSACGPTAGLIFWHHPESRPVNGVVLAYGKHREKAKQKKGQLFFLIL